MAEGSCFKRRHHLAPHFLVHLAFAAVISGMLCLRVWNQWNAVMAVESRARGNGSSSGRLVLEMEGSDRKCGNVWEVPSDDRCSFARKYCRGSKSLVNYVALHYCSFNGQKLFSVPVLIGAVIASFYCLAETAEHYFSPVATLMVEMLRMSPTMGGVTLLALGNGAPDVFASMAAIGGGNSRIGLGAILSAGTFVSAFVVGSVAIVAAPFSVAPLPFVRDVLFYTAAVSFLLILYLKGVVTFWQAAGLVIFYAIFILVIVFMDQIKDNESELSKCTFATEDPVDEPSKGLLDPDINSKPLADKTEQEISKRNNVKIILQAPLQLILKSTIPEVNPEKWSRWYSTANIILCPLFLLFMLSSFISPHYEVMLFFLIKMPLWGVVLIQNIFLATGFFLTTKQAPESGQMLVALTSFMMSVVWISLIAGELVACLGAVGIVLGLSPGILGLTVLAWGNSMGDLVADIAIARAGKPEMAIAGCFAGPMFNMLVGLGFALVLHTSYSTSAEYYLPYHPSISIAFGFLLISLLSSLVVVAASRFKVTKNWGLCLISLYFIFTLLLILERRVHNKWLCIARFVLYREGSTSF